MTSDSRIPCKGTEYKEVFTDLVNGRRREIDLLAQVKTWEGESCLFQIEIQAQPRADFPRRMFRYYSFLGERHQQPIFQIALHLHRGVGGLTRRVYEEWKLGRPFNIHFYDVVGLADLQEREYRDQDKPLAVGLSAFMAGDRKERVIRKVDCLKRILELEPREIHRFLLINLVETGLPLNPSEEEEFRRITEASSYTEVKEMRLIYEERGIQKGLEQGIQKGLEQGIQKGLEQGLLKGKKEDLARILTFRFGTLPEEWLQKIEAIVTVSEVNDWLDRSFLVASLADLGSRESA